MIDWKEAVKRLLAPVVGIEHGMLLATQGWPLRLPDFFCIGFPQSGTTWLYENIILHPDIGVPRKEPRYFDRSNYPPLTWYSRLYWNRSERFLGDMSPSYSLLPKQRIHVLHSLLPDARLIAVLRDPVSRSWSNYRRKASHDGQPSVGEVLDVLQRSAQPPRGTEPAISDYSEYSQALTNWLEVYSPCQLLTIPFSDIQAAPERVLADTIAHIGADPSRFPWRDMISGKVNHNPEMIIPYHIRSALVERHVREHERLQALLGGSYYW